MTRHPTRRSISPPPKRAPSPATSQRSARHSSSSTGGTQHARLGSIAQCDRLGWAALATALDVSLGQPDFSVDQTGWRPRTKPIRGSAKPGVLGVLQAEHNLLVRLKSFPNAMNLRLIVDSQRLLSAGWSPTPSGSIQSSLCGGAPGQRRTNASSASCGTWAGVWATAAPLREAANAVSRMKSLVPGTIIEPRMLGGFQTLFQRLEPASPTSSNRRRARGIRAARKRPTADEQRRTPGPPHPRALRARRPSSGSRGHPNGARAAAPAGSALRVSSGTSRADLHAALIHRPTQRPSELGF